MSSLVMPKGGDVIVKNVPSFADRLDITIQVDGKGTLNADTGYDGDSFVIGDADTQGFFITEDGAHDLAGPGVKLINVDYVQP